MNKVIRSRILEIFPKSCIEEIYGVCKTAKIRDNNSKVDIIVKILNKYNIEYVELGPGTNRYAILIDGYVFKIALDKNGITDNLNEMVVSEELQPFVSKTYETNQLILVAEYVTVISREEFIDLREDMLRILATISSNYLVGDVGLVGKNFCNWGYRDNGELVILDYAYIYRIVGGEMMCHRIVDEEGHQCGAMLEYDEKFHELFCPRCREKYTFMDIRRKITREHEYKEIEEAKEQAYEVTEAYTTIVKEEDNTSLNINNDDDYDEFDYENYEIRKKEEIKMSKREYIEYEDEEIINEVEEDDEDLYMRALSLMSGKKYDTEDDIVDAMIKTIPEAKPSVLTDDGLNNMIKIEEELEEYDDKNSDDYEIRGRIDEIFENFIDSDEDDYEEDSEDTEEYNVAYKAGYKQITDETGSVAVLVEAEKTNNDEVLEAVDIVYKPIENVTTDSESEEPVIPEDITELASNMVLNEEEVDYSNYDPSEDESPVINPTIEIEGKVIDNSGAMEFDIKAAIQQNKNK